jgi:hypothetical protein
MPADSNGAAAASAAGESPAASGAQDGTARQDEVEETVAGATTATIAQTIGPAPVLPGGAR